MSANMGQYLALAEANEEPIPLHCSTEKTLAVARQDDRSTAVHSAHCQKTVKFHQKGQHYTTDNC